MKVTKVRECIQAYRDRIQEEAPRQSLLAEAQILVADTQRIKICSQQCSMGGAVIFLLHANALQLRCVQETFE